MHCLGLRSQQSFAYSASAILAPGRRLNRNIVAGLRQHHRRWHLDERQQQDLPDSEQRLQQSNELSFQQIRVMDLQEFLTVAELQQYYDQFHTELKVINVSQIKYVEDTDLVSIGMTKPEIRRLRQIYKKQHSHGAFGMLKKFVKGPADTSTSPPATTDKHNPLKPTTSNKHIIAEDAIVMQKKLGSGEFGVVQQGVWASDRGEKVPVAVKCLTKDKLKTQLSEFLVEASNMCSVDHSHVVQLYGIVLGTDSLMLVTELAPMRSLLEGLRDPLLKSNFTISLICTLALQIVDGMGYLENRRIIHRDLAARNILMFAKDKVKVSDFGLSRALGVEKDYYQSQLNSNLKLPIAWCAPECINFLKFTSASDVWSYGVTLWEMFSSGTQPWKGMTGLEIMEAVDEPNLLRLDQPERCPDDWYQLMLQCWAAEPSDRPKFSEMFLVKLNQIKPTRVVAVADVSSDKADRIRYKMGDIIVVLSKRQSVDGIGYTWKGVVESSNDVGFFDQSTTSPYIEVIPSNALLRKNKVSRVESSRSSTRGSRKITAGMIGAPQNDLRHVGHVGYDGAIFGDVSSFIGDDYTKLPIKVGNPIRPGDTLTSSSSTVDAGQDHITSTKFNQMTSSATFSSTLDDLNDDFGDFEMPDMSLSLDFGSSLMDEMMKALNEPLSDATFDSINSTSTLLTVQQPSEPSPVSQTLAAEKRGVEIECEEGSGTETASDGGNSEEEETSSVASVEQEVFTDTVQKQMSMSSSVVKSPAYVEHVSTTVKADFIPKPLHASAVITTPPITVSSAGGSSFGATKQLFSLETFADSTAASAENNDSQDDSAEEEESDDEDNSAAHVTNGYTGGPSPDPVSAAACSEVLGHNRNSSGSSGHSGGRGSWNGGSEASVSSSTERLKAAMAVSASSRAPLRSSNQNIRAPQGIPGRDAVVAARNPIIPAASAVVASEPDMDTNPLRRLRESQSGFSKTVFRSAASSSSTVASTRNESLLPSNNLNPNMSFFDKLKEQEQQRMH